MHRIRQILINFNPNEYAIDLITLKPKLTEYYSLDEHLKNNIQSNYRVFQVGVLPKWLTKYFGIGSLSIRSFFHFLKKGSQLIKENQYHLIFFSTTATHLMYLGAIWKKRYKLPFVIDLQDPWANNFYLTRPPSERPPKFRINYFLDSYLESKTIPHADAVISVSNKYQLDLDKKYRYTNEVIRATIPFGVEEQDFEIDLAHIDASFLKKRMFSMLYIGRGGYALSESLKLLFSSIKDGLSLHPEIFSELHLFFLGTSYAAEGKGEKTIQPLASQIGINEYVTEITDRCTYFETIRYLQSADILFIPGSTDEGYTPSKIYTYLMCNKPIIAMSNVFSEVNSLASKTDLISLFHFNDLVERSLIVDKIVRLLTGRDQRDIYGNLVPSNLLSEIAAKTMTNKVFEVFEKVIKQA